MTKKQIIFTLTIISVFIGIGAITMFSHPASAAQAQETTVDLTVYNSNIGMVKEIRQFQLDTGVNQVAVTDVPSQIIPESVHFRSLDDPNAVVLEQNYEYDIVGSQKLLQKYVDQPIVVITQDGSKHEGTLLSGADNIIIQTEDGGVDVLKSDQVRQFSFPALPEGLITRPTLKWLVNASKSGNQKVEMAYLTNGISWQSNYVLALSQDSSKLDLDGWITLDNRSGAAYKDARLKLVAGEVHRTQSPRRDMVVYKEMAVPASAPVPEVEQREFAEYHLYEIPRPVTIKNNQTKQIQFLSTRDVPAEKIFVFDSWTGNLRPTDSGAMKGNISVKVRFNTGEEGVNTQLPAGVVRLYQPDVDGSPLFIGEDRIGHTPKGEDVTLTVGEAFDLVGERLQTKHKRLGDNAWRESYKITLRNHKDEDVEIHVVEHLNRGVNWEITNASPENYIQLNSNTIEWVVNVPADGEAEVVYTVEYTR